MGAVKETLFVFFANVGYCVILDELPNWLTVLSVSSVEFGIKSLGLRLCHVVRTPLLS